MLTLVPYHGPCHVTITDGIATSGYSYLYRRYLSEEELAEANDVLAYELSADHTPYKRPKRAYKMPNDHAFL